jgi:site-specific DNA recombinase
MEAIYSTDTLPKALPDVVKVRYCLYSRKSSESEERQALSVDSQIKEMLQIAEREGLEVVDVRRESHSAKASGERPVFNEIVKDIRDGRFNGVLVWHPDRLSRNAGDLGSLVDLMDQKALVEIRTYGQKFGNSPSDKFLLMILCSQAKLDNDNKGVNVKRGLRMRCEMGLWPCQAPTGYRNTNSADQRGVVVVDPERAPVIKQIFEKVAYEKWTGRKVYHWLKFELNFRSPLGNKHLTLSNVHKILDTPFYYGTFEYPVKSGNWYKGKHTPIITKELFDQAKAQMKRDLITRVESREFAFTKLFTCGLCGSGFTGEVHDKILKKSGLTAHYIYYGCARSRDRDCKGGYLKEELLIEQVVGLLDHLDYDKLKMQSSFEGELRRFNKFQRAVLGSGPGEGHKDADMKTYAKYILREGTNAEKRQLMGLFKTKLKITRRVVTIE